MPEFLRRNPMIAAGILLPLIVALFFVLATAIPRMLVDPPAYDVLFTGHNYRAMPPPVEVRIDVVDNKVRARAYNTPGNYRNVPRLFRYDVTANSVSELTIELPEGEFEDGKVIAIEGLGGVTVSKAPRAPDDYEVLGPEYRGNGLMGMFFGGRRHTGLWLRKDSAVFDIPDAPSQRYYGNTMFLGWVIDDDE